MAFFEILPTLFPSLLCISFLLIILCRCQNKICIIPLNFPVLGMIPKALRYIHRPHDIITKALAHNGGTFLFKGPWFASMDMLWTANPLDIHHVMSKNFVNYPRGHKFRMIFDILGDGFSNTDGELWEFERKTIMSYLKHPSFLGLIEKTTRNKVERGLLPVLEHVSKQGVETDLQEIFQRFAFDIICTMLFENDPESLSLTFPYIPCERAFSKIAEATLQRYIKPPSVWKFQKFLRVGSEKKLSDAWESIDQFIYNCLAQNQKDPKNNINCQQIPEESFNLSKALMREFKDHSGSSGDPNKFLRDNLFNLMIAGRESTGSTLTWFFYLLSKNPIVEDKIREELYTQQGIEMGGKWKDFHAKDACKLVYLHGALSEALRLFPPIPLQNKTPLQPDVLPSGYHVDHKTTVVLSYYSMGRMKSIWGDDCMEFKPERWISTGGGIKCEPSYKFPAFNAGPRTCLGKDMSFTHMKIVAAAIIHRYHVELVEGHPVFPSGSTVLYVKNGLKVKLTKRS